MTLLTLRQGIIRPLILVLLIHPDSAEQVCEIYWLAIHRCGRLLTFFRMAVFACCRAFMLVSGPCLTCIWQWSRTVTLTDLMSVQLLHSCSAQHGGPIGSAFEAG